MNKKAFTLVELSIVLLIIGLIVGAITSGFALVHQAQLRVIMNENSTYQTAVNTFMITYNALPGDMRNASSFWPSQSNGNGNGQIEENWGNPTTETIYFWGHLSNSGLINGNYSGVAPASFKLTPTGGSTYELVGVNVPASKYGSNTAWGVFNTNFNLTLWYGADFRNYLLFGTLGNNIMIGPGLTTSDAYQLDLKFDDGLPNTGSILGAGTHLNQIGYTPICVTSGTATGTYILTNSGTICMLGFRFTSS